MTEQLTHLDESGAARMVDVSDKRETLREATAECFVRMAPETARAIRESTLAKGDALAVARVAGLMAMKKVPELIPLCHPLFIQGGEVNFELREDGVLVTAHARMVGKTGVELEAMTAVAIAGLTLIDMVKALEKGVSLENVRLMVKTGGKSGDWRREEG
jgi:cyclic pyranopterin phosphate synthase